MSLFDFKEHSHRRLNILTGEWIQVSPHRSKRPWQGQLEKINETPSSTYDPHCYLCPGNKRSNGEHNPVYRDTYSFENDFAAIVPDVPGGNLDISGLMRSQSERGICKVICFSPQHNLTIPEMSPEAIIGIVNRWTEEYVQLGALPFINYVQIFENKGAAMGCSNPHPHGQIWAQESIPVEPAKKQRQQEGYFANHGNTLLADYLALEERLTERVVAGNDHFIALVPFWATWPFEIMIVPRRAMANITMMTKPEKANFAAIIKDITVRYDNLFETSFPYSAGIHQAPTDGKPHPEWHWHMVFYPPLLRSATVKKFMVGYEMLANPQRDVTPEYSAERLRETTNLHYKTRVLQADR